MIHRQSTDADSAPGSRPLEACVPALWDIEQMLARSRAALDVIPDAVLFVSWPELHVLDGNQAACQQLGYAKDELCTLRFVEMIADRDGRAWLSALDRAVREAATEATLRLTYRTSAGVERPASVTFHVSDSGEQPCLIAVSRGAGDIPAADAVPTLSQRDDLTDLPRRKTLEARLHSALEQPVTPAGRVGLLFLDVDAFKLVNDQHGHVIGDGVLRTIAERLAAHVRHTDLVCRFGGDEFVVLLEGVDDDEQLLSLAQRISSAIQEPIGIASSRLKVSASIGVAVAEIGESPDALLNRADQAMYQAKSLGRCGRCVLALNTDRG